VQFCSCTVWCRKMSDEPIYFLLDASFDTDDGSRSINEENVDLSATCDIEITVNQERRKQNMVFASDDIITMNNQSIFSTNSFELNIADGSNVSISLLNCCTTISEDPIMRIQHCFLDLTPRLFDIPMINKTMHYRRSVQFMNAFHPAQPAQHPTQTYSSSRKMLLPLDWTTELVFLLALYVCVTVWCHHLKQWLHSLKVLVRQLTEIIVADASSRRSTRTTPPLPRTMPKMRQLLQCDGDFMGAMAGIVGCKRLISAGVRAIEQSCDNENDEGIDKKVTVQEEPRGTLPSVIPQEQQQHLHQQVPRAQHPKREVSEETQQGERRYSEQNLNKALYLKGTKQTLAKIWHPW